MVSFNRKKQALKAAVLSYVAGVLDLVHEVNLSKSLAVQEIVSDQFAEERKQMLLAEVRRCFTSFDAVDYFAQFLSEEGLYPFRDEWPKEIIFELLNKIVIPDELNSLVDTKIRFKKGFKKLLNDFAEELTSDQLKPSGLDHWLVLLINSSFYGGALTAARLAENSKPYFEALSQLEQEVDPWMRFSQLEILLERQLARETKRKTGLVNDFDF